MVTSRRMERPCCDITKKHDKLLNISILLLSFNCYFSIRSIESLAMLLSACPCNFILLVKQWSISMQSSHHGDIYQVLATIGNLLDLLIESVLHFTSTVDNR